MIKTASRQVDKDSTGIFAGAEWPGLKITSPGGIRMVRLRGEMLSLN